MSAMDWIGFALLGQSKYVSSGWIDDTFSSEEETINKRVFRLGSMISQLLVHAVAMLSLCVVWCVISQLQADCCTNNLFL
jgi:hypothetical protein